MSKDERDERSEGGLLPCPFCGATESEKEIHVQYMTSAGVYVECFKCEANSGVKDSPDEAIAAWNTRPSSRAAELEAEGDELRAALQVFVDSAPIGKGLRCFYCDASVYGNNDVGEHSPECELEIARGLLEKK